MLINGNNPYYDLGTLFMFEYFLKTVNIKREPIYAKLQEIKKQFGEEAEKDFHKGIAHILSIFKKGMDFYESNPHMTSREEEEKKREFRDIYDKYEYYVFIKGFTFASYSALKNNTDSNNKRK